MDLEDDADDEITPLVVEIDDEPIEAGAGSTCFHIHVLCCKCWLVTSASDLETTYEYASRPQGKISTWMCARRHISFFL